MIPTLSSLRTLSSKGQIYKTKQTPDHSLIKNTEIEEASPEARERLQLSTTFHLSFLEAMARKEDVLTKAYSMVTEAATYGHKKVFPLILAVQGSSRPY